MNYTVKQLSALTGLTPRTLRWYDTIGLLRPRRNGENDYRIYGPAEVERLTQILLYREMGLSLEEIGRLLDDPAYDRTAALRQQLDRLLAQRQQVDRLISVVTGALAEEKGENNMSDQQKFEALRDRVLRENEENYGREAREKYGDRAVDDAGARLRTKDQAAWARMEADAAEYQAALVRAMAEGDPAGESRPGGLPPSRPVAAPHLASGDADPGGPCGPGGDVRPGPPLPGLLRAGGPRLRRLLWPGHSGVLRAVAGGDHRRGKILPS